MISIDDIKIYLPQYLSASEQDQLFGEIRKFPFNLDSRFYSHPLTREETIYQGDGVKDLLIINLPDQRLGSLPSMIISNTCDIDPTNKRYFQARVLYSPIFVLEKYENLLISQFVNTGKISKQNIESHIATIKKQEITQILYLPEGCGIESESIVFLDRINNCPAESLYKEGNEKIFTLSNYGFYILLIKLSIHFTRVREGISRFTS